MFILVCALPAAAQTPTPDPTPGPFGQALLEANDNIVDAQTDLTAPNGVPILPNETGARLFAYAKWILSANTADELVGPFAGIIQHLGILVTMVIIMSVIYAVLLALTYILEWIVWFVRFIADIISATADVVGAIASAIDAIIPF